MAHVTLSLHTRFPRLVSDADVEPLLFKPAWSSARAGAAAAHARVDVAQSRASLCATRPRAAAVLQWVDGRAEAYEPGRRLARVRHLPWTEASVRACVAAVQRMRRQRGDGEPTNVSWGGPACGDGDVDGVRGGEGSDAQHRGLRPWMLIAQGSLGLEAAAAAAAGARVTVCEPNRFAARAIGDVVRMHGVAHQVQIVREDIETFFSRVCPSSTAHTSSTHASATVMSSEYPDESADMQQKKQPGPERSFADLSTTPDIVCLTPLVEPAALGMRLLAAARAVSLAAIRAREHERHR
eukprot:523536-Pleurochrysis_carterae.AAC.1